MDDTRHLFKPSVVTARQLLKLSMVNTRPIKFKAIFKPRMAYIILASIKHRYQDNFYGALGLNTVFDSCWFSGLNTTSEPLVFWP